MESIKKNNTIILPALRGAFGNWIYYSCLMPLRELGMRARYASELHPTKSIELSKFIQRALDEGRSLSIAKYLTSNNERFFNSLVLAVYGGNPDWLEIGVKESANSGASLAELADDVRDSIGFLRFSGDENIFAIDGQHRLSGIKHALLRPKFRSNELVPVIFVGHANTTEGLQRTRRLFTVLNKTAVPVKKRDIIALDEDDVMAVIARALYETDDRFSGSRMAITESNNLPQASEAFTTIGNLYDILKEVFMNEKALRTDTDLRFNRPSDVELDGYRQIADNYFSALATAFPPLGDYYQTRNPASIVKKHRSEQGGHILFRPIGLSLITASAIALAASQKIGLTKALKLVGKLETNLAKAPYAEVIWDTKRNKVIPKGKTLARRLMFYMLDIPCKKEKSLLVEYRKFVSGSANTRSVDLPKKVN